MIIHPCTEAGLATSTHRGLFSSPMAICTSQSYKRESQPHHHSYLRCRTYRCPLGSLTLLVWAMMHDICYSSLFQMNCRCKYSSKDYHFKAISHYFKHRTLKSCANCTGPAQPEFMPIYCNLKMWNLLFVTQSQSI